MKRILITGANRGLGLGLTRLLLQRGDRVWAFCRKPDESSELQLLKEAYPAGLSLLKGDTARLESIEAAYSAATSETDSLDWLINNAGQGGLEDLEGISFQRGIEIFATNSIGPFVMARVFKPMLAKGENPLIVQMSSRLGSVAERESEFGRWVDGYVYPGSKAALNMMSRQLWKDLKPEGITVVIQSPGWVRTDMGGPAANLDVETSVSGMVGVWDQLGSEDGGRYLSETGEDLAFG